MTFRLKNAPACFQRVMDVVLAGLKWNICLVYLDDIVIFSETFGKHLERLESVLARLYRNKLTLKPSKCLFAATKIQFLGHVVEKMV